MLNYSEEVKKDCKKFSYQEEMTLVSYAPRNNFIKNLALDQSSNSLLLFQYVEKHSKVLYDLIKDKSLDRKVFFVYECLSK